MGRLGRTSTSGVEDGSFPSRQQPGGGHGAVWAEPTHPGPKWSRSRKGVVEEGSSVRPHQTLHVLYRFAHKVRTAMKLSFMSDTVFSSTAS